MLVSECAQACMPPMAAWLAPQCRDGMALCCRGAGGMLVLGECMGLCVSMFVSATMQTCPQFVAARLAPRCHEGMALCYRGVASLPVSCCIWGSAPHNPSWQDTVSTVFYCNLCSFSCC